MDITDHICSHFITEATMNVCMFLSWFNWIVHTLSALFPLALMRRYFRSGFRAGVKRALKKSKMKKPALIFFGRPLFRQSLYDYRPALFGPLKFSLSFKISFPVLDISKELMKDIAYLSM